ncbi:MAG TPA: histidinol dehydrogenase, partial [Deinococcales bacterium]|nr:histidinol dehydrogenase [Deinococcales bacterium]
MRLVEGFAASWQALTRGFGEVEFDAAARERNRAIYGEPLGPHEAVERIIRDVRAEGDAAVKRYAALLDGVPEDGFEVGALEIEAAHARLDRDLLGAIRH